LTKYDEITMRGPWQLGHFVPDFDEIQSFSGGKGVSLKKVLRLKYPKVCPNKF